MSEEVGKHKGAVETLLHEKKELSRLLQIVNSQLERHLSALEDAGVNTDQFIQDIQQQGQEQQKKQNRDSGNNRKSRSSNQREKKKRGSSGNRGNSRDQSGDAEDMLEDDDDERDFSPL
jgi:hypothetical protein